MARDEHHTGRTWWDTAITLPATMRGASGSYREKTFDAPDLGINEAVHFDLVEVIGP